MSFDCDEFHSASKWEEPWIESHPMLTLYDLNRNPRPVKDPAIRMTLPTKNLHSEFICPICMGYIRNASLVMECLHRFCDECIQKCLRFGKKECPSCRIHIPSRRSLRHDEEFDLILLHIMGDVRVLEQEEERQAKLARTQNMLLSETRKRGMMHQQEATQQKKMASPMKKLKEVEPIFRGAFENAFVGVKDWPIEPKFKSPKLEPETELKMEATELVELLLLRHPQERQLDRLGKELITISGKASIHVLTVFLSRKLSFGSHHENIMIFMIWNERWVALDNSMLIGDVARLLRDDDDTMMTLCYRVRG